MQDIKNECLSRWKYKDDKLQKFENEFDDWINQFSEEFKPICYKLLERFDYYSFPEVNEIIASIYNSLISSNEFNNENTLYGIIENDESRIGSSAINLTILAHTKDIDSKYVFNKSFPKEIDNCIKNIVLIDDFCGSGKTVIKFLSKRIDEFKKYNIYIIFTHVMQSGKEEMLRFAKNNNLNLKIAEYKSSRKIFETDIFPIDDSEKIKEIIEKETVDKGIDVRNAFGYEDCQSLVAFFANTPNNTLAIFRKDTGKYKSIFPRKERVKKPKIDELIDRQQERGKQNLNNKIMVKRDG